MCPHYAVKPQSYMLPFPNLPPSRGVVSVALDNSVQEMSSWSLFHTPICISPSLKSLLVLCHATSGECTTQREEKLADMKLNKKLNSLFRSLIGYWIWAARVSFLITWSYLDSCFLFVLPQLHRSGGRELLNQLVPENPSGFLPVFLLLSPLLLSLLSNSPA